MDKEEEKKEELGMKDTVEAEVKKGKVEDKRLASSKRDKALALAHDKYVKAIEAARKEYVKAKEQANKDFEEATK